MNDSKNNSIDEYLKDFDDEKKQKLLIIRNIVKTKFPSSDELISYRMPAFKFNGKILIYFAAFKNHVSIFPAPRKVAEFEIELKNYKGGKGTIQFPDSLPLPVDLIERIVKYRADSIIEKSQKPKLKTLNFKP